MLALRLFWFAFNLCGEFWCGKTYWKFFISGLLPLLVIWDGEAGRWLATSRSPGGGTHSALHWTPSGFPRNLQMTHHKNNFRKTICLTFHFIVTRVLLHLHHSGGESSHDEVTWEGKKKDRHVVWLSYIVALCIWIGNQQYLSVWETSRLPRAPVGVTWLEEVPCTWHVGNQVTS